jgi:hypothetical protein
MSTTERLTERHNEATRTEAAATSSQKSPSPSPSRVGGSVRASDRMPERIIIRTPENRFGAPGELTPPSGMDYGWKVKYVRGAIDRERYLTWKQNGWKEVPAGRHPHFTLAPEDSQEEIERGGLVLCERPMVVSAASREMDRDAATAQVQTQLQRLEGRARQTGSQRVTKVSTSYEPVSDDV